MFQKEASSEGSISKYQALSSALSGTIGLGNIAGVALAIQLAGPGAVFWIWVTAFMGILLKYNEVYLAMISRTKLPNGSYHGGPMVYFEKLFKNKY